MSDRVFLDGVELDGGSFTIDHRHPFFCNQEHLPRYQTVREQIDAIKMRRLGRLMLSGSLGPFIVPNEWGDSIFGRWRHSLFFAPAAVRLVLAQREACSSVRFDPAPDMNLLLEDGPA